MGKPITTPPPPPTAIIADTVIYNTMGTASPADDIAIMVLEDFNQDLSMVDFDIV